MLHRTSGLDTTAAPAVTLHARLAARLRQLRRTYGWTQQEVATALGVHLYTYGSYERFRVPPMARLAALAALYGIPLALLLTDAANDDIAGGPARQS